jgi:hypothetical protein
LAKVMICGWVQQAVVVRSDLLRVRMMETAYDPKAKKRFRQFWSVDCWGAQVKLEPYLEDGSFVAACGTLSVVQMPDGKVFLNLLDAELTLGPKKDEQKAARLREGARDLTPGQVPEGPELEADSAGPEL